MGRVSTLCSIVSLILQVILAPVVGSIAHNIGLTYAVFVIGSLYLCAVIAGWLSGKTVGVTPDRSEVEVC